MYDGQKGNNIILLGGVLRTVPELLFEKKGLIPKVKQSIVEGSAASEPS